MPSCTLFDPTGVTRREPPGPVYTRQDHPGALNLDDIKPMTKVVIHEGDDMADLALVLTAPEKVGKLYGYPTVWLVMHPYIENFQATFGAYTLAELAPLLPKLDSDATLHSLADLGVTPYHSGRWNKRYWCTAYVKPSA